MTKQLLFKKLDQIEHISLEVKMNEYGVIVQIIGNAREWSFNAQRMHKKGNESSTCFMKRVRQEHLKYQKWIDEWTANRKACHTHGTLPKGHKDNG